MMRILYWTGPFLPYIGGIQVLAPKFLCAMKSREYEFVVIAEQGSLDLPDRAQYGDIPIHRFHFWQALASRNPLELLKLQERIAQLKRDVKPDLVHLNLSGPSLFFYFNTARIQPAPCLVALRGAPPEDGAELDTLFGRAMRSANWVTAVSAAALDRARQLVPEIRDRSCVIYNALELPAVAPMPLSFNPPRLLCLGRLVAEKGFDLALRAFARLVEFFPNLSLTIAGDGPERATLEQLTAELGLGQVVEFVGWVQPERVPELINTASIVVVSSRTEGLPQVSLQAAQMARPVVATRVGGLEEIVADGETGYLVPPEDSETLASAIAKLLAHPEDAKRMGITARFRVQERFDWKSYLDAYDALYSSIYAGGSDVEC